jgi:hypothetical protein
MKYVRVRQTDHPTRLALTGLDLLERVRSRNRYRILNALQLHTHMNYRTSELPDLLFLTFAIGPVQRNRSNTPVVSYGSMPTLRSKSSNVIAFDHGPRFAAKIVATVSSEKAVSFVSDMLASSAR